MFLKTLAISDGRLNRALMNQRVNQGVVQPYQRGKYGHHQRISNNETAYVKAHPFRQQVATILAPIAHPDVICLLTWT